MKTTTPRNLNYARPNSSVDMYYITRINHGKSKNSISVLVPVDIYLLKVNNRNTRKSVKYVQS